MDKFQELDEKLFSWAIDGRKPSKNNPRCKRQSELSAIDNLEHSQAINSWNDKPNASVEDELLKDLIKEKIVGQYPHTEKQDDKFWADALAIVHLMENNAALSDEQMLEHLQKNFSGKPMRAAMLYGVLKASLVYRQFSTGKEPPAAKTARYGDAKAICDAYLTKWCHKDLSGITTRDHAMEWMCGIGMTPRIPVSSEDPKRWNARIVPGIHCPICSGEPSKVQLIANDPGGSHNFKLKCYRCQNNFSKRLRTSSKKLPCGSDGLKIAAAIFDVTRN